MAKNWERFERLVAAIHLAEQQGATVKWNDCIKGRQFDVTIRFRNGLYEYLTIIECKDRNRPIEPEVVDAVVTKSTDAGANKAIIVSSSGYTSGAVEVAKRHNIELLTLSAINRASEQSITQKLGPMLLLYDFRLRNETTRQDTAFPEPGVLRSLMRQTVINGPGFQLVPEDLMKKYADELRRKATTTPQWFRIDFPPGTKATHASTLWRDEVSAFLFQYRLVFPKDHDASRRLDAMGLGFDPYLTGSIYTLNDEIKETQMEIDASRLEFGVDTVLAPGRFYQNPNMGFSYYCENVEQSTATMWLVESYQMGNLVQCCFTQDIAYARQYVEITDKDEIKRLSVMLQKLKST